MTPEDLKEAEDVISRQQMPCDPVPIVSTDPHENTWAEEEEPVDEEKLDKIRKLAGEAGAHTVVVSDEMMPGVVSLPHGFGHNAEGARMRVARQHAGVNSNLLTDEKQVDALSGNGVLNGIPLEVTPP